MTVHQSLAAGAQSLALGYPGNAAQNFLSAFHSWWATASQKREALRGYCAALDREGQVYRSETEWVDGERQLAVQAERQQTQQSFAAAGVGFLVGWGLARYFTRSHA